MSRQAGKGTAAELLVRSLLRAADLRYRVESPVPGMARRRIDVAFTSVEVAVLINGRFWHNPLEHAKQSTSHTEW
ncbi:hypothetical protein [Streptomyces chrestomyceticus]|uniref:hypothetical protein n=1 Tax=Streptomyces chrestomyceticus TaxID=68185 RepID=UPI00378C7B14